MAQHEFGMMERGPLAGERYDEYNPEAVGCLCVDDGMIEPLLKELSGIGCYWHTLDVPGRGLAYTGITLIPPSSLGAVIRVFEKEPALSDLTALMRKRQLLILQSF